MAVVPDAAKVYSEALGDIQLQTRQQAARLWAEVSWANLDSSWRRLAPALLLLVEAAQVEAAWAGATYGAFTLAGQDRWVPPTAFVDPSRFGGGWSSSGVRLDLAVQTPLIRVKQAITGGATVRQARQVGLDTVAGIVDLQVNDAGRAAASVDVAARPNVGYTRMLNPPSCDRCTVLAGRFYRWNAGFRRHPRCDCVHVQSTAGSSEASRREGLIDDPYDYFRSLSDAEQDSRFGRANAQAVRDGADLSQVINAGRGRNGLYTTEGTSRRGNARGQRRRLTPDGIYRQGLSREDTLAELRRNGYLLPGGQVPGGSLRGQVGGFGALGRGGSRTGARKAVEEARRTGRRDPRSRATQTAAERRLGDAERRYRTVLEGRSPTGRGPLTPEVAAQAEADYRRWLGTGGQVFTT